APDRLGSGHSLPRRIAPGRHFVARGRRRSLRVQEPRGRATWIAAHGMKSPRHDRSRNVRVLRCTSPTVRGANGGQKVARTHARSHLVVIVLAAMLLALLAPGIALGVHDFNNGMQLDGDVSASTRTTVGSPPPPAPPVTQTIDWDSLFTSSGSSITPRPAGFT